MHDPRRLLRPDSGPPYEIAESDPRISREAEEIARRLRPLYPNMPDTEFAAMMRSLARTKLRWG